ncbi:MAG: HipA domain-containing protein [Actinomycetota bacterium]|nr:HipA domain-containing protein [Actinomycetota bacterium]
MYSLAVWLYGIHAASIEQERGRLRLSYTEQALARYQLGTPLLSLSLPLADQRYPHGIVRPFLDGLLPEGEQRRAIANDVRVPRDDTYALIRELGRDCAGALVIQPDNEPAPPPASTLTAEPLSEKDIGRLVENLRGAPLGAGGRVRISLAGVQEKLLLTRMPDGKWGRPVDGTPSTHILKPEIARYPNTVENEVFCMRFARHLGLPVAHVEAVTVNGRRLILVERYDRMIRADGSVERIHQEDFCQATGTDPDKKYEEDGGPSLRSLAGILQTAVGNDSLDILLRAVTMNVLIGNGDAHGKNFSIVHDESGALRLAPLYDLMSTLIYGDDRLAMHVDTVQRMDRVTVDRLVNEAAAWGFSRRRAAAIVDDIIERASAAAAAVQNETEAVPPSILQVIDSQLARMRDDAGGP